MAPPPPGTRVVLNPSIPIAVNDVDRFGPLTDGCQPTWQHLWPAAEATPLPSSGAYRLRLPVLSQGCAG